MMRNISICAVSPIREKYSTELFSSDVVIGVYGTSVMTTVCDHHVMTSVITFWLLSYLSVIYSA